ncbi:FAD-binding oxidoreductase [Nocardia acidivorans]|uniref:FAD-binding oxidoreductase n=1 Tax=Nocardia acidivorans TaxID=404580 RepID=UPI000A6CACDE|nr:FAD-binding protein [Nocardia acidivorans]
MSDIGSDLRRVVRGRVLAPGEEGFEAARRAWNSAVEQRVSAVVEVVDAADVAAVVEYAAKAGVGVTAQATGHGASAAAEGTVLLKTAALDRVEVDAGRRTARVGAGVRWGALLERSSDYGLAAAVGSSPVVGVTGYTLGGGLGWFARSRGFAANGVRAAEVVAADGTRMLVTADSDPELFWALRGGGGDFAVVTALEFDLFDTGELYGGRMLWPAEQAEAVLAAYREATLEAGEGLSIWVTLVQFPPFPQVPEFLRGKAMVAVDAVATGSDVAAVRRITVPLRWFEAIPGVVLDNRRPLRGTDLGGICMEPTTPSAARARGQFLTDLSTHVTDVLLGIAAPLGSPAAPPRSVSPLALVQIRHLGGALTRPPSDAGAAGGVREPYLLSMLGPAPTPEHAGAVAQRQHTIVTALHSHVSGRKPMTYLDAGDSAAEAFAPDTLARLRSIKRRYDPAGTIRGNFPVSA